MPARLSAFLLNSNVLVCLLCFCLFLTSCKGQEAPDPKQEEILRKFKTGGPDFILEADAAAMQELAEADPSASFYAGLLVREGERSGAILQEEAEEIARSVALFQAALGSPAVRLREEAARELIEPVLAQSAPAEQILPRIRKIPLEKSEKSEKNSPIITLHIAGLYVLGRYGEIASLAESQVEPSSWDRGLALTAGLKVQRQNPGSSRLSPEANILRGKLLAFLLTAPPDEAYTWTFRENLRTDPEFFSEAEGAAILGRFAVSESAYAAALRHFRLVLEQDRMLFFQYPDLIGDLGRTFQYVGDAKAQAEGIALFLDWNKTLQTDSGFDVSGASSAGRGNPGVEISQIRFRILYFLGRIERRRQNYLPAAAYFKDSLPFAPDDIQEDAAVWYVIDTLRLAKPENLLSAVDTYLERRHDPSYFSDVLDHLCRSLTLNRQWPEMLKVFPKIRNLGDGGTLAKYAYILGRVLEEGYISVPEAEDAVSAHSLSGPVSEEERKTLLIRTFFRIAFEEGSASFYYRSLSASRLGEAVIPVSAEAESLSSQEEINAPKSDELELLLGFFEFGAASQGLPYIQAAEDRLSVPELRILARLMTEQGMWLESIRLVNRYMIREDHAPSSEDMRLYYPRAYRDIIEQNAEEAGLPPEMLYGLIRTESAFDSGIRSQVGALGLTQLMPGTAKEWADRIRRQGGPDYRDNLDLQDPSINVHIGAAYLKFLLGVMKSPMQALLSYNGGYNRVQRWRAAEPKLPEDLFLETIEFMETREYGKKVLGAAAAYGYLYFGMTMEAEAAKIFQYPDLLPY
ncbi:MAG: lytic transglycosylase domain-containing protein [Spirochaetaceae bacterium]|nr:lytic transglycosylase domain-containing protein [Spirochaetaceae bacterium]